MVKDKPIKAAMLKLAGQYSGFGCRRMQVFLERSGWLIRADRA
jgi:hypothetical protein